MKSTPGPWRWADWNATFGTLENGLDMRTLEHNPTHPGAVEPVVRTRTDGGLRVLILEEPIENEADRMLIQNAPEVAHALGEMLDMFGGNMDREDYERFRRLIVAGWEP